MDKTEELKAQIEASKQMEKHYFEMWGLYFNRLMSLQVDLKHEEKRLNNLIHFCQSGRFLDD